MGFCGGEVGGEGVGCCGEVEGEEGGEGLVGWSGGGGSGGCELVCGMSKEAR